MDGKEERKERMRAVARRTNPKPISHAKGEMPSGSERFVPVDTPSPREKETMDVSINNARRIAMGLSRSRRREGCVLVIETRGRNE